ncbi:RAD55 family ATPase [Geoglobus ahangari]
MGSILLMGSPGTGKTRLILKYLSYYDKALWVSTTESAPDVRRKLVDFDGELWVVDTHTWDQKVEVERRDIIVSNPMNLNEVSIAIGKALDSLGDEYFIAFDSISGLLLYHTPQKVIHFLRNIVVRMNTDNGAGIFTLVKNAHDVHVETSISLVFHNIIELERVFNGENVKRFIKIIRASQYVEKEVAEIRIVENDVAVPKVFDRFIKQQLNIGR